MLRMNRSPSTYQKCTPIYFHRKGRHDPATPVVVAKEGHDDRSQPPAHPRAQRHADREEDVEVMRQGIHVAQYKALHHPGEQAHGGGGYLSGDMGPDNQPFNYRLEIDLSPYANAIDTGNMSFEFRGWGRSYGSNNDPYRMRLRYRSSGGAQLSAFNTGDQDDTTWTEHVDIRLAPVETTQLRIDFYCKKPGGTYCDAYYDDIVVIGTYDGP